jgi:hypothetical protein
VAKFFTLAEGKAFVRVVGGLMGFRDAHYIILQVRPYNCTVYNGYSLSIHHPSSPVNRTPNGDRTGTKMAVLQYTEVCSWYL